MGAALNRQILVILTALVMMGPVAAQHLAARSDMPDIGRLRHDAPADDLDGGRVAPSAWRQTAMARGAAAALLLAVIALGVRLHTSRIRRRARQLEAAVAERTDDLRRYARAMEEHAGALVRANTQIRRADRARTEFLANMSHELRTPLNSIIGFSEVLAPRLEGRVEERELHFLGNVSRSGRYLLLLINNLLDLSKMEAERMDVDVDTVDLEPVLRDTLRVVQGYVVDRSVAIEVRVHPGVDRVRVDVAKLTQILINILSNAIKFSPTGSTIDVVASPVDAADSSLGVPSYEIAVTDQGRGIREEDRSVIFEMFHQAETGIHHPGGTGIGLALVQRFTRLLGGSVDFDSAPDQGTTFRVLLPVEAEDRRAPKSPRSAGESGVSEALWRPCVLIVEPDRQLFGELAQVLERSGALPVRANDPDDAAHMAEILRPAALVLRGSRNSAKEWTVLRRLVRAWPSLSVALIGGSDADALLPVAADSCLFLPVDPEKLVDAVALLAAGSRSVIVCAGGGNRSREFVRGTLEAGGFVVSEHPGTTSAGVAEEGVVVIDLDTPDPGETLRRAREISCTIPRVILLPQERPSGVQSFAEAEPADVEQLGVEINELLLRRAVRPQLNGGDDGDEL